MFPRIAPSSRIDCLSAITSRNPCSAETTHDAPEHAGATSAALRANKNSHVGSPLAQSTDDTSAEIAGRPRNDNRRVTHDSDIRERTPSM